MIDIAANMPHPSAQVKAVTDRSQATGAWLNILPMKTARIHCIRCLPVVVPVFLYPAVGTFQDIMLAVMTGALLFILHARAAFGIDSWRWTAGLSATISIGFGFVLPAAGLSFALIAFFECGGCYLPPALSRLRRVFRVIGLALAVDLSCMILELDRSLALMIATAMLAMLIGAAYDACDRELVPETDPFWVSLCGGSLACATIASYLYLVTADSAVVVGLGDAALFSAPFAMLTVLRIFHLGFAGRRLDNNGLELMEDRCIQVALIGWCLSMSLIELIRPVL